MTDIPNRTVEMYRIFEEPDQTWDLVMVELPANTPEDKLEEVARIHAVAQHGTAAYMIYNSMEDECPHVPIRLDVPVLLSFDLNQITAGPETEQEAAAVELINLTLQREPHGLGARIIFDGLGD